MIKEVKKDRITYGDLPNKYEAAFEKMKEEGEKIGLKSNE